MDRSIYYCTKLCRRVWFCAWWVPASRSSSRSRTAARDFRIAEIRASLPALEVRARSTDRETTLSKSGQLAAVERLLRVIVNRLRFENDAKRHPQIDEQTLLPPLVI